MSPFFPKNYNFNVSIFFVIADLTSITVLNDTEKDSNVVFDTCTGDLGNYKVFLERDNSIWRLCCVSL